MVLYNVTTSIENAASKEWLQWLQKEHIPALFETGLFAGHKILHLLNEEENGGTTYAVQYFFPSHLEYTKFINDHSDNFDARMQSRFGGRYVFFTTLLEVIA